MARRILSRTALEAVLPDAEAGTTLRLFTANDPDAQMSNMKL